MSVEKGKGKTSVRPRFFQNNFVFDVERHAEPKSTGKSRTVPGQAYSVQQLYDRSVNGLLNDLRRDVSTFGDGDLSHDSPDLEQMTRSEILDKRDYHAVNAERIAEKQAKLDEYNRQVRARRDADKKDISDVLSELKERRAKASSTPQSKPDKLSKEA